MSTIQFSVHVQEIGCTAKLNIDLDDQESGFWEQFDTRGEGIEDLITQAAQDLADQLRAEYDKRDAINQRVKELGA